MFVRTAALATIVGMAACSGAASEQRAEPPTTRTEQPTEAPVMLNTEPPFRYPAALYAQKAQGNVMLRLYIDSNGRPRPESTRVEQSSSYLPLDSAAIKGSQELQFIPAKLHGEAVGVAVLFPVYFRHPEGNPMPGDSILGKREAPSGRSRP